MALPATMSTPLRAPQRWVLAVAALVASVAHIPVTPEHLTEAPYMGVLFVLLSVACVVLAGIALVRDVPAVYLASAAVCGLAIVGYAATRLVAFPMLGDDVGNWLEPLGVVSILSEAIVVGAALSALRRVSGRPGRTQLSNL